MAEWRQSGSRVDSSPMRRSIVFAVLSFLLLFMQQEMQLHALSHLGPQLVRSHETAFVAPHADDTCVACALLAAGSGAAIGADVSHAFEASANGRAWFAFLSRAADAPSYYSSRAPPILL